MSICTFCAEPTFAGKDPAASFAQSRGDIWENLISGIITVYFLPSRLSTNHTMRHPKHKAMLAAAGASFDAWEHAYRAEIALLVSTHPDMGDSLKAAMEKDIHAK